jgi:putative transposase
MISKELLDQLLKDYKKPDDLLGEGGIIKELTKALVERCLNAEIENYMSESAISDEKSPNRRNGYSKKRIKGEFGEAEIQIPRDRNSDFEPILVPKGQSRITGLDDKILSLYARGMTTRDIQDQIKDL